ncbi:hypothetical protein Q5W10_02145, partial [Waltera intestinalis]
TFTAVIYSVCNQLSPSHGNFKKLLRRYLLPVNTQKHCISNSLKYHASPHFLYCSIDIITLLSDTPLGVTVSIKKEASSLFTHY